MVLYMNEYVSVLEETNMLSLKPLACAAKLAAIVQSSNFGVFAFSKVKLRWFSVQYRVVQYSIP